MTVVVRDLASGRSAAVSHDVLPPGAPARTAYNPAISGDGRLVAFEASDSGRDGRPSTNGLWLVDRANGAVRRVRRGEADATYDPVLSADGSTLVFTAPSRAGPAQVHALDVASGETEVVSRAGGERGRRARVLVRDRRTDTTEAVPAGGRAFGPALSPDGGHVAFSVRRGVTDRRPEGSGAQVWLYRRAGGAPRLVSRADGPEGRGADGHSLEAVVSRDGRFVAFTSDAANLDASNPAGLPGVFARDVARGTTRLMSSHAPRKPAEPGAG